MENLRLVSFNVNGLRGTPKRRAIFQELRSLKADLCFLQETHSTPADQKIWLSEWAGKGICCHGKSNSKGVAVLFHKDLEPNIHNIIRDPADRYIIFQLHVHQEVYTMINAYAPTQSEHSEQMTFIQNLEEELTKLEVNTLILGGDLNIKMPTAQISQTGSAGPSYYSRLLEFMDTYNLTDIWAEKNPRSKRGMFHRGSYSARLDYWLIATYLSNAVKSISITPQPLSDHSLLQLDLGLATSSRGPGFWRFQNTLLADQEFTDQLTDHINEVAQEEFDQPTVLWDWIKYKIRAFCIQYTIKRNRETRKIVSQLEARLKELAEEHDLTDSEDVVLEVTSIKRELGEIAKLKATTALFRSKSRWAMLGEKPTAYFLGMEKRASKDKTIMSLKGEAGRVITNNKEILEEERKYFEKIFTEDPSSLDSVDDLPLEEDEVPTISDMHRRHISQPFTIQEFHAALKDMSKNKCPGTDGLTTEFYLHFWEILKVPFMNSISFSLTQGELSESQKIGVISLIPKKNLDRQLLSNWRPITLLNCDFKIFSKALARRVQSCIKEVVSSQQTGFIRGRSISENLTTTRTIIDYVEAKDQTGILLTADYAKAFDSFRWALTFKALQMFGFGDYIIQAIKLIFKDIKTCVTNAGFSSSYFTPTRGIRQGCCVSPSLFVLTVELLAILVCKSQLIKGLNIAGETITLSQYADDTTFFLKDFASVQLLLALIERFSRLSGLRINKSKSHLLLLGNHLHPPEAYQEIQVVDQVKILGLVFKTNITEDENYKLNFEGPLTKISRICNAWSNMSLSIKGKITVLNSLVISLLQYPCSATTTPIRVLTEFKKISTTFVWSGKRSKIAYNLLIQDLETGGLRMADLQTRVETINIMRLKYLWNNPNSILGLALSEFLGSGGIKAAILQKSKDALRLPPQFSIAKQFLDTWQKLHFFEPISEDEIQQETIWHNDRITVNKQPLIWQKWREAGIVVINDLLHREFPRFLSHEEIQNRFGVECSFLQVLQIRSAIPCKWKRTLIHPANPELELLPLVRRSDGILMVVSNKSAKKIYQELIKCKTLQISSQNKWADVFPIIEAEWPTYWKDIYTSAFKAARDTKFQALQFKLIHRIIPCNKYLKNIRNIRALL